MDIYWGGQALIRIKGKHSAVVIDPFDQEYTGLKLPKDLIGDLVLVTHDHQDHNAWSGIKSATGQPAMMFDKPGEYEVSGVVVTGVSSFHDNEQGAERGINTIFHIMQDGMNLVHLGDLGQSALTEEQLAQIGSVDILFIPVGGLYTIDAKVASNIVSQLEPSIIIPIHYKIEGLKFDLAGVEGFLKEMGAENVVVQQKLSINKDKLPEEPEVVVLSKN